MTDKKIIQVCFSLKDGLTISQINDKLTNIKNECEKLYGKDNYEIHSCHLNKAICIEKNFSTEIPDLFNTIFGDNYVCEITETTFDEAMANMESHRTRLSCIAHKLVMLVNNPTNTALEIELFTKGTVMII